MRFLLKVLLVGLFLLEGCLFCEVLFAGQTEADRAGLDEILEFGEPLSSNTLDSLSGGEDLQIDNIDMLINNMNLRSQMEENLLISTTTGANLISNDAFSHANGISTVIQNSGNQVIINSALILNLRIQ
jgi:hypothetical protein